MRYPVIFGLCLSLHCLAASLPLKAQEPKRTITAEIAESKRVTLGGNTTPAASRAQNDRGAVADDMRFDHLLILLKRDPETEASLKRQIDALHDPASPEFHHWLTPEQIGARFGAHPDDVEGVRDGWSLTASRSISFIIPGLVLDVTGSARQIREER